MVPAKSYSFRFWDKRFMSRRSFSI